MSSDSDAPRRSVIGRVAKILSAFDRHHRSMPLTLLAQRAGLPVPTTYRLVTELQQHGLLERDENKDIRIGIRLWELSTRGNDALSLRDVALPYMDDVYDHLKQFVSLAILDHGTVLYLERMAPDDFPVDRAHVAQRHPIHAASAGLLLLAFASQEVQDDYLARPLQRYTERTVTDPMQLRRMLSDIRQRRHALVEEAGTAGWVGVAVPILGQGNSVIASLSSVYPMESKDTRNTLPALQAAAFGISMAMGATPKQRSRPRAFPKAG